VISKGLGSCLLVHTVAGFEQFLLSLSDASGRDAHVIRRFFVAETMEMKLDARGRVRIPRRLVDFAGIGARVVWRGRGDYAELWDKGRFDSWLTSEARG
jgi:MraZ protein